ncbi:hypothetical protein [Lichenibacterium ramalinae]|nr:hypothetical protein [Lichenibacterium ramalinae]
MSVAMARRYVDAYEYVKSAPVVAISVNALETYWTWARIDPFGAAAERDAVLAGEVPLSKIQSAIRNARARASVPVAPEPLSVDQIIQRFEAAGIEAVPHPDGISVHSAGESWIGLSAEATFMLVNDEGVHYRSHQWALLVSPALPGSPLAGLPFEALLLRVAAAAAIYDHVSLFCLSAFEREEVSKAAAGWWPFEPGRISIL